MERRRLYYKPVFFLLFLLGFCYFFGVFNGKKHKKEEDSEVYIISEEIKAPEVISPVDKKDTIGEKSKISQAEEVTKSSKGTIKKEKNAKDIDNKVPYGEKDNVGGSKTTKNPMTKKEEAPDNKKSDSTGSVFKGEKIRDFPTVERQKFFLRTSDVKLSSLNCTKWAVLTTINEPSEAVRRFSYDYSWCVVIVGDLKSSEKEYKLWSSSGSNVIFLNDKDQTNIQSEFVNAIPWKTFGRKNVGYLYAIAHGAQIIYDFDDDNMHKFWIPDSLPRESYLSINDFVPDKMGSDFISFENPKDNDCPVFNPYPYMGGPNESWPRGFPLDCNIKSRTTFKNKINKKIDLNSKEPIGVLQSLADNEPDVDAIYRLTRKMPFSFSKVSDVKAKAGLILPYGVYTPYNAQATLHYYPAFWATYLPVTVGGRVSDILRSYVAKRLFDIMKIRVGFIKRSLVVQIRNSHDFLADFNAEIPLYQKTSVLLKYLDSFKPSNENDIFLPEVIRDLWISLYERGYVEKKDVILIQKWLQSLIDVGYKFPGGGQASSSKSNTIKTNFNVGKTVEIKDTTALPAAPKNCLAKKKTFWNSDYPNGESKYMQLDSIKTLSEINQNVQVAPVYKEIIGKLKNAQVYNSISPIISSSWKDLNKGLTEKDIKENKDFYEKNDADIKKADVVFCQTPASSCELWKSLIKKIVFLPGSRYNIGKCSLDSWKALNTFLKKLTTSGDFVGSISRYDSEYMRHYTNIDSKLFPSQGWMGDKTLGSDNKNSVLVIERTTGVIFENLKKAKIDVKTSLNFTDKPGAYRGVIFTRSLSVSSYDLISVYSSSIPIFVPSLKYLREKSLFPKKDEEERTIGSHLFCKDKKLGESMSPYERTWHPYNPNTLYEKDSESEVYWRQLSDMYDLPHITKFDSEDHLVRLLQSKNFKSVAENMKKENEIRKHTSIQSWCSVITNI